MLEMFSVGISTNISFLDSLNKLWQSTGLASMGNDWYLNIIMLAVAGLLLFLAISKKFEPNLLLAMAFGMFIINIPGAYEILYPVKLLESNLADLTEQLKLATDPAIIAGLQAQILNLENTIAGTNPGLFDFLYKGVEWVIFPPIIFLGIGAMTDFGPLIANPKSLLLGAAAQIGIFLTFILAILVGFPLASAAAIGIIGGADGPTAIYLTSLLAPKLMGSIAIAAYSYMALVPVIQPPIMKALTTKKERSIVMEQ